MLDVAPFLLSSTAGLILVVGCLFLLWKGRIVLDTEGKSVSKIDLPMGIKLSTQFPVVVLFLLGVVLLLYPVYQSRNICVDLLLHKKSFPEMVKISGKIVSKAPVDVFAVVDEQSNTNDDVLLNVPFKKDTRYRVVYALDNQVLENFSVYLTDTKPITLQDYEVQPDPQSDPNATLTGPRKTVSKEVAAEFKKGESQ